MIEKIVMDYLGTSLTVPVHMETPPRTPDEYIIVEKTGSTRENHLCSATIAVQSYAATLFRAAELNESVKAAMDGIVELDSVCAVTLNSDYNFTDTATKKYRYQAVFDISHY